MPGIEHDKRSNEPQAVSRQQRHHQGKEDLVLEDGTDIESIFDLLLNGYNRDENGGKG